MAEKDFIVKKGLQVGESITTGGTVDGRTLSTDGAKLDGIDAGATNYTDSDVAIYLTNNDYVDATYLTNNDYVTATYLTNNDYVTATYLTNNDYVTQQYLSTNDYITQGQLSSYATTSYVQSQLPDTEQLESDISTATALALIGL